MQYLFFLLSIDSCKHSETSLLFLNRTKKSVCLANTDNQISFLRTVYQRQQEPHLDYSQEQLEWWKRSSSRSGKEYELCPYPWSLDLPLTRGGLSLVMYGQHLYGYGSEGLSKSIAKGDILEIPTRMDVPYKHALLWR